MDTIVKDYYKKKGIFIVSNGEKEDCISDNSSFYENSTIEETVDYLESDWELWLFWVIWIIVIGLCVFGFYYIDNEWIEN